MNKSESKIWWEQFGAEFFHDAATLVVEVDFGDGMRKYCKFVFTPGREIVCFLRCMV